jgi:type IV secretory pathway VirB10-like protein
MVDEQLKINIGSLTKAKFLEYAKQRKVLDSGFERLIVRGFDEKKRSTEEKQAAYAQARRERIKNDPEFKLAQQEKNRLAYAKKKEKLLRQKQPEPAPEPTPEQTREPSPQPEEQPQVYRVIDTFGRFNLI